MVTFGGMFVVFCFYSNYLPFCCNFRSFRLFSKKLLSSMYFISSCSFCFYFYSLSSSRFLYLSSYNCISRWRRVGDVIGMRWFFVLYILFGGLDGRNSSELWDVKKKSRLVLFESWFCKLYGSRIWINSFFIFKLTLELLSNLFSISCNVP